MSYFSEPTQEEAKILLDEFIDERLGTVLSYEDQRYMASLKYKTDKSRYDNANDGPLLAAANDAMDDFYEAESQTNGEEDLVDTVFDFHRQLFEEQGQ